MAPIPILLSTTHRPSKIEGPLTPILIGISSLAGVAEVVPETTGTIYVNIYANLSLEMAQPNT